MAQSGDLEGRVTALETQVRDLSDRVRVSEHDAAAARVLAGGADRDVAEIRTEIRDFRRANTRSFNAMREDLIDLRQKMRAGFDATAAGQEQIVNLLTLLINREEQGDQPDES